MIELRDVSCIIGNRYVLKHIDWKVRKGEHWAVIGLNGAGKTTLLNMINGYVFPSIGTVKVMGKTFGFHDWRLIRRKIGFVSSFLQEKFYPSETAEDIVLSGLYSTLGLYDTPGRQEISKARNMLDVLQCGDIGRRRYSELSQGEKQKVLIARALISSPALLILDEPSAGLDIIAREKLLASIESIGSGKNPPTMIYVAHHIEEIVSVFRKALLLKNGRVHSSGQTEDMFTVDNLSSFLDSEVDVHWVSGRAWVHLRQPAVPVRIKRTGRD
jgi:iron complex transport system ATP-binding protein